MIDALASLATSLGGRLVCGSPVREVSISGGRATGAVLADGHRLRARRAVVSNVGPRPLFGDLVPAEAIRPSLQVQAGRYRHAPGTLMLHLSMDDLPAWKADASLRQHSYVHIGPYLDDMALAYGQAQAGLLPVAPTLVVGQPTAVDPTRAPDGKHVLWVMVRFVPGTIRGDAAQEIHATDWAEAKEPFADRVVAIIETYAPGFSKLIRTRAVLSPQNLEDANPNLVGGDIAGGSHHPMQYFFLRPFPGWSRYRTPIDGLYLCGAATWPGAGVGGVSGYLLGRQLLSRSGWRARLRGRAVS